MKKNSILRAFIVVLTACVTFASCDKSPKQETAEEPKQTAPVELKVAYVEVDSLMPQHPVNSAAEGSGSAVSS